MARFAPAGLLAALLAVPALAAEDALPAESFAADYGRYAPAGDCGREPLIVVEAKGLTITVDGQSETIAKPDIAWSYGGHAYEGKSHWLFPYYDSNDVRPVIITLSANDTPGTLLVEPQDHGFDGGPALSKRHKALVDGSPYLRCK